MVKSLLAKILYFNNSGLENLLRPGISQELCDTCLRFEKLAGKPSGGADLAQIPNTSTIYFPLTSLTVQLFQRTHLIQHWKDFVSSFENM